LKGAQPLPQVDCGGPQLFLAMYSQPMTHSKSCLWSQVCFLMPEGMHLNSTLLWCTIVQQKRTQRKKYVMYQKRCGDGVICAVFLCPVSTPSFCGFWHCHPYIPIHFWKMFFLLVYIKYKKHFQKM